MTENEVIALKAEIERLKLANAELIKAQFRPLTMKVSEKGAISVYGLQKFPVTLYRAQWARLLTNEFVERFNAFTKAHASTITEKAKVEVAA